MMFVIALFLMTTAAGPPQEMFDLHVERVRPLRNQRGELHIDATGVTFRSDDGKSTVNIPIEHVRAVDVANPRTLRFGMYEVHKWKPMDRREYTFRAQEDGPVEQLAQFFAAHIARPVVGHYPNDAQFEVAAYHRRALGGTNGKLTIGADSIQFVSETPADSRTWLYRDIETIGKPDPFRFRVTTSRETYIVELKEQLPGAAYEVAWRKVYKLEGR